MNPRALVLYGTEAPLPERRTLHAGALCLTLEEGQLRHILWQGREAIRGIAFLVRNTSWGTYEAKLRELNVEANEQGFRVSYEARCEDAAQRLDYGVTITADAAGHLQFHARIHPHTDFLTNRAGFIVLHPLEGVAGEPVTLIHADGRVVQSQFPKHVAPRQPFSDLRALEHQVSPGVRCRCTLEGDAFETEDQRNWADASFKTYVRPLSQPWPYTLRAGAVSEQCVRLSFVQEGQSPALVTVRESRHAVELGREPLAALPELGLALDAEAPPPGSAALNALSVLSPSWLLGWVSPSTPAERFENIANAAASTGAKVCLEVVVDAIQDLQPLAAGADRAGLPVAAVAVTPSALLQSVPMGFVVPGMPSLEALYQSARQTFPAAKVGGGSLAYFTELNRNPPPTAALDFITHTTCPLIHAADDASVMETLQALPWIFESALRLAGQAAYWIGPSTIGMRFNPYGPAPADNPHQARVPMAKADPRQRGLFAAAHYTAYAARAARAGVSVLTLSALTGPRGVLEVADGRVVLHPAFHALSWLADGSGRPRLAVDVNAPDEIEALAWWQDDRGVLLLANTTAHAREIALPPGSAAALVLDEGSFDTARTEVGWSRREGEPVGERLKLGPYAVARVDVRQT